MIALPEHAEYARHQPSHPALRHALHPTISLSAPSLEAAPADSRTTLRAVAAAINSRMQVDVVRVGPAPSAGSPVTPSGFPALDEATGLGGFPCGRLTEIIGQPTAGREAVAAHTVAAATGAANGMTKGMNAWVDVPGLIDVDQLARFGVDLDRLFILRPNCAADALAITAQLLASGHFHTVVLDSLADIASGGATAQDVGRFVRVVTPALGRTTTAGIILSAPEQHYRPVAHAAALRLSLVKVGLIRRGGVFRGWRTRVTVLKSPGCAGGESGIEVWL
jgi:recombination protein RecA